MTTDTGLTREQELALVEALECGSYCRTDINQPYGLVWGDVATGGYELTPAGRIVAQLIKERDEARDYHARWVTDDDEADALIGDIPIDRLVFGGRSMVALLCIGDKPVEIP